MPDCMLIPCCCMLVVGGGIDPSYRLKDTDDDYRLKDTDDDYRLKDIDGIVWYVVCWGNSLSFVLTVLIVVSGTSSTKGKEPTA